MGHRASMITQGLNAATFNQRLCGIRKLVNEARENGTIDPAEAVRITSVGHLLGARREPESSSLEFGAFAFRGLADSIPVVSAPTNQSVQISNGI